MEITPQLVDKLALLSKLEFDAAAREEILRDLKELIAFVEKLKEVDTTGVEPLIHLSENEYRLRQDIISTEITQEEALKNAPLHDEKHIKVPKVIKKS
ncbi:MAG: Asp-tRNA(Asn)/Glu-tRNA(Gln) amidotransferase subunit GatC [Chitinophagales bacterium]|nr:Asp-tRNA(Asn)/Glu-tRNA(Gln) amidotransferase subunit GatC [Chitinophagales bacterium]